MSPTTPPSDIFDSLISLEQTFHQQGVTTATPHATTAALSTGHDLGFRSSVPLISELEFYRGAATTFLSLHSAFPSTLPPKAITTAQTVLTLCQTPPVLRNDPDLDFEAHLSELRTSFRQMVAFARMPALRFPVNTTARVRDLDF